MTGEPREEDSSMAEKDLAKQVIDSLPEQATLDDIIHALYVRAKFERGEREVREGRGVSQEAARQRLRKWAE
jgi:hypothetical protein